MTGKTIACLMFMATINTFYIKPSEEGSYNNCVADFTILLNNTVQAEQTCNWLLHDLDKLVNDKKETII